MAAAAMTFSACSNEEDLLFEDSSANRLEASKSEISRTLAADGGKWVMEYFANSSEPGYLIALQFTADGSVTAGANHKWVFDTYTDDTSLWEIIADDGPVLTFNSYNEILHQFASPEDIDNGKYPFAPTNPDTGGPVNEVGKGHEGDYEFVVMEGDSNHDMIRLLGKKRGYNIYLHRLPADTDLEAYLTQQKAVTDNMFSDKFNTQILVDAATGERFVFKNMSSGVAEVYPEAGDAVTQTVKHNFIATSEGIRFMTPFYIPRADESADDFVLESMSLQSDGTLTKSDGTLFYNGGFDVVVKSGATWQLTADSFTGAFADIYKTADRELRRYDSDLSIDKMMVTYNADHDALYFRFQSGTYDWGIYYSMEIDGDNVKLNFSGEGDGNGNGIALYQAVPGFKKLIDAIAQQITVEYGINLNPSDMTFVYADGSINLSVR